MNTAIDVDYDEDEEDDLSDCLDIVDEDEEVEEHVSKEHVDTDDKKKRKLRVMGHSFDWESYYTISGNLKFLDTAGVVFDTDSTKDRKSKINSSKVRLYMALDYNYDKQKICEAYNALLYQEYAEHCGISLLALDKIIGLTLWDKVTNADKIVLALSKSKYKVDAESLPKILFGYCNLINKNLYKELRSKYSNVSKRWLKVIECSVHFETFVPELYKMQTVWIALKDRNSARDLLLNELYLNELCVAEKERVVDYNNRDVTITPRSIVTPVYKGDRENYSDHKPVEKNKQLVTTTAKFVEGDKLKIYSIRAKIKRVDYYTLAHMPNKKYARERFVKKLYKEYDVECDGDDVDIVLEGESNEDCTKMTIFVLS